MNNLAERELKSIFPHISLEIIQATLIRAGGVVERAAEYLLDHIPEQNIRFDTYSNTGPVINDASHSSRYVPSPSPPSSVPPRVPATTKTSRKRKTEQDHLMDDAPDLFESRTRKGAKKQKVTKPVKAPKPVKVKRPKNECKAPRKARKSFQGDERFMEVNGCIVSCVVVMEREKNEHTGEYFVVVRPRLGGKLTSDLLTYIPLGSSKLYENIPSLVNARPVHILRNDFVDTDEIFQDLLHSYSDPPEDVEHFRKILSVYTIGLCVFVSIGEHWMQGMVDGITTTNVVVSLWNLPKECTREISHDQIWTHLRTTTPNTVKRPQNIISSEEYQAFHKQTWPIFSEVSELSSESTGSSKRDNILCSKTLTLLSAIHIELDPEFFTSHSQQARKRETNHRIGRAFGMAVPEQSSEFDVLLQMAQRHGWKIADNKRIEEIALEQWATSERRLLMRSNDHAQQVSKVPSIVAGIMRKLIPSSGNLFRRQIRRDHPFIVKNNVGVHARECWFMNSHQKGETPTYTRYEFTQWCGASIKCICGGTHPEQVIKAWSLIRENASDSKYPGLFRPDLSPVEYRQRVCPYAFFAPIWRHTATCILLETNIRSLLAKDPSDPVVDSLFKLFTNDCLEVSSRVPKLPTATMTLKDILEHAENSTKTRQCIVDARTFQGFRMLKEQLFPHQLHGLNILLERELQPGGTMQNFYQRVDMRGGGGGNRDSITFNKVFHLAVNTKIPIVRAGILSDYAGCGKTMQIMGLISCNPAKVLPPKSIINTKNNKATLYICTSSLIEQSLLEFKTKSSLQAVKYHSDTRKLPAETFIQADVVITNIDIIVKDFNLWQQRRIVLSRDMPWAYTLNPQADTEQFNVFDFEWHRIILDDVPLTDMKHKKTDACCHLRSSRRLFVNATPFNNNLHESEPVFSFLGLRQVIPHPGDWKTLKAATNRNNLVENKLGINSWFHFFSHIANTIMQRHPKTVIDIAPCEHVTHLVSWNLKEKEHYQMLCQEVHMACNQILKNQPTTGTLALNSQLNILRQFCASRKLKLIRRPGQPLPGEQLPCFQLSSEDEHIECSICLEIIDTPTSTPCRHIYCRECIMSCIHSGTRMCPLCREPICIKTLKLVELKVRQQQQQQVEEENDDDKPLSYTGHSGHDIEYFEPLEEGDFFVKSKLEALQKEISSLPHDDKVIVFTQFDAARLNIEHMMRVRGIKFVGIKGSMTPKRRGAILEQFRTDPTIKAIVLSMRGMARGLNITAANHVFFFEPCLDAAMISQAINRIERIGQNKTTKIHHMLMEESAEVLLYDSIQKLHSDAQQQPTTNKSSLSDKSLAARVRMLLEHIAAQF